MTNKLFTLKQAAEQLELPYNRIYWAVATNKVTPLQAGHSRLLTADNIEALRKHFAEAK